MPRHSFWGCVLLLLPAAGVMAGEVKVAVAANFAQPLAQIAADFQRVSGHVVTSSSGSTGKFYAQISNGAPFDVLLAADDETPARLEKDGKAIPGSRFTYAVGRLVLWSATPGLVDDRGNILRHGTFRKLALANPRLAPYGAAAVETLTRLGLQEPLRSRFVIGENIAQTWQFVGSGNAELGFVALSQVWEDGRLTSGSAWRVPDTLHSPIRQDAVLLKTNNAAAQALMDYLRSEAARVVIRRYGYDVPRP